MRLAPDATLFELGKWPRWPVRPSPETEVPMESFGSCLPRLRIPPPGPRSRELARRLRAVETRTVTFLGASFPVFWEEARGANVRDVDGNVYVDLTGAFGVAVAGHAPPGVVEAIGVQAGRLVHGMGDVHPSAPKVALLERLAELGPWPETRGLLASSGSEAVEIALKTAYLATGRKGVLAFEGAYHGLTLGALAVTARPFFREPFAPLLRPGVRFLPFPDPRRSGGVEGALEGVGRALSEAEGRGEPVGAVIVEPIQGRAGVRVPPPGFLAGLADRARAAGALLVFDEIFSGMGRTGRFLAAEHEGVVPDLVCLGKGLGGGLPLSVCLGPPEVMDAWPASQGEALHTSTFLGHPLACAAALAQLRLLLEGGLVERADRLGGWLRAELERRLEDLPIVGEVRGRGLFLGVELVSGAGRGPLAGGGVRAAEAALARGLLLLPAGEVGHVVEITPPLVATEEQLGWCVGALREVLEGVEGS